MSKRFFALLTALVLTLALTACGSKQNNSSQTDTPAADNGSDTVTPNRGDDGIVTAPDTTPGQSPAVTDDPAGRSDDEQSSMDEMLKNARVRDRDGDLLDGENHVTPGADRW